jgi:hypothetical protein
MATSMAYAMVTKRSVTGLPTPDWPIVTFWPD